MCPSFALVLAFQVKRTSDFSPCVMRFEPSWVGNGLRLAPKSKRKMRISKTAPGPGKCTTIRSCHKHRHTWRSRYASHRDRFPYSGLGNFHRLGIIFLPVAGLDLGGF